MSEENPTPNPAPESTPVAPVADLKPLTEAELATMSTEESTAHAEKLESIAKESVKQTPEQIRENQTKRLLKGQEKVFAPNLAPTTPETIPAKSNEIAQGDILTLAKMGIDLDSDKQKLLQERVQQGVIKSYAEGLSHVGVSAELAAIDSLNTAKTVIDENDDPETQLKTTQEVIAQARTSGEVPEDPKLRKALAEDNLKHMSSLK
jgi:hypothetical protein